MGVEPPSKLFSLCAGVFQIILLVLFSLCTDYGKYFAGYHTDKYLFFQDIHVMIFVGFGFLMTFLKKYSFGAVGYNMFISALVLQWATLVNGWIHGAFAGGSGTIEIDLTTMITSDFAAGAVLITFGAVLGKVSRLQLLVIGIFEVVFYALNENLILKYIQITDVGGSMIIHMFGAYFGLAVARMLFAEHLTKENEKEGSVYHSDVFAMIGTIFLWMFWPSFNGGLLGPGPQQNRALINTYFSLAACCVTTFVVSPLVDKKNRLDMVHIQNATLAGGVAVGTCADLIIRPWGAILIGMLAGVISTLGYAYVTPFLVNKLKIHDTCGVNNLHGMPAILAAIAGGIAAATASLDTYKGELFNIWGARAPSGNTTFYGEVLSKGISVGMDGAERSAGAQGGMQIVAMVLTLAIAIIGGAITGLIVKFLDVPGESQVYDDKDYWITPNDEKDETSELLMGEKNTTEA